LGARSQVGLIIADIDQFKQVNDQFGHDAGDGTLRLFALRASFSPRSRQTVFLRRDAGQGVASNVEMALLLDIDHFTRFNDAYGHRAGEDYLCTVEDVFGACGIDRSFAAQTVSEDFAACTTGREASCLSATATARRSTARPMPSTTTSSRRQHPLS
jgi:GGDEF domain-containing protein